MTDRRQAWGAGPSDRYDQLADRFRPIFRRIAEGAVARERERILLREPIGWLKEAGFGALRVPEPEGGHGATLPELLALLIELSEADSNVTQALRAHFGHSEDVLNSLDPDRRARGVKRLASGAIVGGAWTEVGDAIQSSFATTVRPVRGDLRLTGRKFYTTGSLYADWIDVGATDAEGQDVGVVVSAAAPGVEILDDWDGFGQILTASGTAVFTEVTVDPADVVLSETKLRYGAAFYQLVHLATLAGIGRAITRDVAAAVAARRRTFTNAAAARPAEDPQVLQVVGEIRGRAYTAGAIVLHAAKALQFAFESRFSGDAAAEDEANILAELEAAQAQNVVIDLVVVSAGRLFDALGASSTRAPLALDRHWRNARTLASHNPRIYKERIVGDYAVNGTPPPFQWRIGLPG